MQRFDFTAPISVRSRIREVEALAQTLRGTQDTIARFLALSSAIAAEEDFDRLMQQLLDGTAQATEAWGACAAAAGGAGGRIADRCTLAGRLIDLLAGRRGRDAVGRSPAAIAR